MMRELFEQIKHTIDHNLYYVAFSMCLIIPDICGAMSYPDGTASGKRYIEWFDKYVGPKYASKYSPFDGKDCYYLRCGLIHQGRSSNDKLRYSQVIFIEPNAAPTYTAHQNVINGVYNIDLNEFCTDILTGAEDWLNEYESQQVYIDNYSKSIKRYQNGLPPYIYGIPVIG